MRKASHYRWLSSPSLDHRKRTQTTLPNRSAPISSIRTPKVVSLTQSHILGPTQPIGPSLEIRSLKPTVATRYAFVRHATIAASQISATYIAVRYLQDPTPGLSVTSFSQRTSEADVAISVYSSKTNNIAKSCNSEHSSKSRETSVIGMYCTQLIKERDQNSVKYKSGFRCANQYKRIHQLAFSIALEKELHRGQAENMVQSQQSIGLNMAVTIATTVEPPQMKLDEELVWWLVETCKHFNTVGNNSFTETFSVTNKALTGRVEEPSKSEC